MTALSIQPPYPIFTDRDGEPLDAGYVYIGAANLDPQGNPIVVYWDAALTQSAAQPIRTINGYPSNAGTPGRLYVDSDYSIAVLDSRGQPVYSAASATERFSGVVVTLDASDVTFTQAGAGATQQTLQNKLTDLISVKDFGAIGDGVANDAAALQAALTAGAGHTVYFPSGTYLTNATLTIPADTTVMGDGYSSVVRQTARERNVFEPGNNCTIKSLRLRGDGTISGGVSFERNNGIYIAARRNVKVLECFLHGFEFNGIYLNDADNILVMGCYIWGNANSNSSSADILAYGVSGGSSRINITKNFCFSNNSQGIYVDALGADSDLLIEGNVCVPLDPSTWAEVALGSLVRRHGIIVGYLGGSGGRYVVSNNLCRRSRQTGIYYQGAAFPADCVQIIGNQCTSNGINPFNVDLAAGIFVATQGDGDIIANNTVEDFSGVAELVSGGIVLSVSVGAVSPFAHTMVSNNVVRASGAHGILLTNYAFNVQVAGNLIIAPAFSGIAWFPTAGVGNTGQHTIRGNRIERATTARPGMEFDFQASTHPLFVTENYLLGEDFTAVSANNVGIKWSGNPTIHILNNQIRNFYHGVYQSAYLTGRAFSQQFIDRNTFILCTNGIMVAGTTTAPVLPVQDNVFVSCVTKASGAALGTDVVYIAQRFGDKIYFQAASVPTVGTWAIGDRAQQSTPVVGQPKGWMCTVAGNPGTWVSEGNL